jgi:Zn-dependent M28 family amino/carboxypeptidase
MKHVEVLADTIGVRREGTDAERRAGAYIARQLAAFGYRVRYQTVALPNGTETRNVYAVKKGTSPLRIVLGAHYDSKRPSPGANDNGSGVGIVLELARVLKSRRLAPTLVFVFFGAEEMIGSDGDEHHFGSRAFVERMNGEQRAQVAAMVSVDMVGAGDEFLLRTMGRGPGRLSDVLLAFARQVGTDVVYRKDPGESGWSDHEPFEMAGIPAAWLEWVSDPVYHTSEDTPGHIRISRIRTTGRLLQRFITTTKIGRLRRLAAANTN